MLPVCTTSPRPSLLPSGFRGLRDMLEGLAHPCLVTAAHRQITQRHHSYEPLVAIQNRQAANLVPLHELDGVLDLLIVEAVGDVRGHRLADGCGVRIVTLRHCSYGDVTVREHPDEPVAITDRKRSDIESSHLCGGLLYGRVGMDDFHPRGHDLFEFHPLSPSIPGRGSGLEQGLSRHSPVPLASFIPHEACLPPEGEHPLPWPRTSIQERLVLHGVLLLGRTGADLTKSRNLSQAKRGWLI